MNDLCNSWLGQYGHDGRLDSSVESGIHPICASRLDVSSVADSLAICHNFRRGGGWSLLQVTQQGIDERRCFSW